MTDRHTHLLQGRAPTATLGHCGAPSRHQSPGAEDRA